MSRPPPREGPPAGWVPGVPNAVAVLEAAYRVDLGDEAWSKATFDAVRASLPGAIAAGAFFFDAGPGRPFRVWGLQVSSGALGDAFARFREAESPQLVAMPFVTGRPCAFLSELADEAPVIGEKAAQWFGPLGIVDAWGLVATDLAGVGYSVSACLDARGGPVPAPLGRAWAQVVAHLTAAVRVRQALAAGGAPAEGVLEPGGRLVHAEGPAREPGAREALQRAARQVERARVRHRAQPGEALAAWQALVAGRWTLIERFDADGKRFLLARKNEPAAPGPEALSERERQAVAFALMGHSNKLIGYALGLSGSTVAGHLARAARKLGARGRVELVQTARAMAGPFAAKRSPALRLKK